MSRSNGIGFAMIIGVSLFFGTGLPANADWNGSPFWVSCQQVNGRVVAKRPDGALVGCQTVGAAIPILAGYGVPVPDLNLPLPMPIGEERMELRKSPSTESGKVQ
jgi:hypothetical protein